MLLGGFPEGLGFAFQGLQPQVPVGLGITIRQRPDFNASVMGVAKPGGQSAVVK